MSDVSNTNELIEKLALAAEDAAGGPPSAEQVDALIAYADALRDALEAATRVPVQGEPNDNREALKTALYVGLGGLVGSYIPAYKAEQAVNEILSALSRATVPDAATAAIERVTAERDAAMARIAKAWELHEPFIWSFGHGPVQSCKWCADHGVSQEVASWPCPTVAALDGAPEPEWEWAVRAPGDDEPFSDVYQTREHLAEQETGIAWGEEQLIRRRKAGPWLPVEGEKP